MPRLCGCSIRCSRPTKMPRKSWPGYDSVVGLRLDKLACLKDDIAEHLRGQHAGIRVVPGVVVAIEQGQRGQAMRPSMGEGELRAPGAACLHKAFMRDAPQCEDRTQLLHFADRAFKEIAAG